ncbi:metal-sulfur cluster assembly factor [Desertibaculum subflavum]|uniref:metal-sulfur cluster assembly factor n=1 Tax=Desertibaculum subflavum TaxID=2268458 RepID=UPI000E672238
MGKTPNSSDVLDPEILDALQGVTDPEVGLSIVDLGLVYRAARSPEGIELSLTMTTRSCPLGELLLDEARDALVNRYGATTQIVAGLVWEPPWHPDRISDRGRAMLRG